MKKPTKKQRVIYDNNQPRLDPPREAPPVVRQFGSQNLDIVLQITTAYNSK